MNPGMEFFRKKTIDEEAKHDLHLQTNQSPVELQVGKKRCMQLRQASMASSFGISKKAVDGDDKLYQVFYREKRIS